MKNVTSLLIACSLALAGAALAQQPNEQPTPKNKHAAQKTHATEAQPGANAAKPEATVAKQRGARNERAGANAQKAEMTPKREKPAGSETNVSGQPGASAAPGAKQQAQERRKGMKPPAANANASPRATPAPAAAAGAAPPVSAAGRQNAQANVAGGKKAKPDPQQVQQIKTQHANFRAQPKPDKVPAVTFNQNYRIQGSDQWQGPQYEVFRSYHPERHDQGWYRSHYNRVELIGGGYYFFNNGFWFPAWGYDPSAEYYAYDAPIYVGHHAEPPDKVIADVQAVLQEMGYYRGEVDGLLGPLTREALTAYQTDQGLATTAVIDQPTLDSLGMG
jgi:Putative peptidoglycan binding domain